MSQNTFSKRIGIAEYPIQVTDLNDKARNRIRNFLISLPRRSSAIKGVDYSVLARYLWTDFYAGDELFFDSHLNLGGIRGQGSRINTDNLQPYEKTIREILKDSTWSIFFDISEYIFNWIAKLNEPQDLKWLCDQINTEFTKENIGYRAFFVDEMSNIIFHPVSDELEQKSFEESINSSIDGIREHLTKSSRLFKSQDFSGSALEAIKALEAKLIQQGTGNTAGDAIKTLRKGSFHPRLLDIAEKVYAYRNQEVGHGKLESSTVSPEDAKFVLVTVSAVINLLDSIRKNNS
jgi:hypothetical protein